jgi:4'-phosphopantetheinyl transferase
MTIRLLKNQIDLWMTSDNEIYTDALLNKYRQTILSENERQREKRFYFERDRRQYVITRTLVRSVLSRYANIAPDQWSFVRTDYGRPVIANNDSVAKRISFNISHTEGIVLLGVTSMQAIGVDVENLRRRVTPFEIADQFLTEQEEATLFRFPANERPERFFHYWTLKEAYVKAQGQGFSIPLKAFSFELTHDCQIKTQCELRAQGSLTDWRFWLLRIGADHIAAVCTARSLASPQTIAVKSVVPLMSEGDAAHEILSESG